MNLQDEIELTAPPQVVWDYVQDYARRQEWDRSVARAEKLGDGPLRAGAVLRLTTPPQGGASFTWDAEYVTFDPPRKSAVKMAASTGLHPFRTMAGSWAYDERGGGTLFRMTMHYNLKWGWLGLALDRVFLRRRIARTLRESLEALRERLAVRG
ncbi:MAG: SRPBCC family protein [Planctomycetes bacterium]|nr:SRPBCC family protein [Planctomycetota bacterium]